MRHLLCGMTEGFIKREQAGVCWLEPAAILAAGGVRGGFSTRLGGVSKANRASLDLGLRRNDDVDTARENFRRLFGAAGIKGKPAVLSQVHSDRSVFVTEESPARGLSLMREMEADAMICDRPGTVLITHHADCAPVFLYDPEARVIALVHAGWRGAAVCIAAKCAERMICDYGCHQERMLAAIGPCICGKCFETDGDVPDAFRASMGETADPFIRRMGEKWHVDIAGLSAVQLMMRGILPGHIARTELCTCCREDLFYSHRRMGADRGTMAAFFELI
ncbi:MAG: peptidoglycan editing factor PgeF [Clostridia bacterium]|nr:peptidoglycan editing factor PgeF [Clostridia bacterium]